MKKNLNIFCFRRDLRWQDNAGFYQALADAQNQTSNGVITEVLPLFIFDTEILSRLPHKDDRRVTFIFKQLMILGRKLNELGSGLEMRMGVAVSEIEKLFLELKPLYGKINFYSNFDDEPYPKRRDQQLQKFVQEQGGSFYSFKDHLIFARDEILSQKNKVYTIYTPYKKAWLEKIKDPFYLQPYPVEKYFQSLISKNTFKFGEQSPKSIESLGFQQRDIDTQLEINFNDKMLSNYATDRDYPGLQKKTSYLGIHLRFGTISPRKLAKESMDKSEVWLSELIWREFFAQVLSHHPYVVNKSFRLDYENINWRKDENELNLWKLGQTGYPLVDAGMRELATTGFMHNRVRMVVASFLTKHLLHHWFEGERWFAGLLLDYDLASNNGNWQWAAGTGCDAAPYFRVFNPETQMEKFDPQLAYVKKWVPEYQSVKYPRPMVEHAFARDRALSAFKKGLNKDIKKI